jgi:hypothetical protein
MIKLHPETAQEIANLITSIACADIMYKNEGNTRKRLYWMAKEFKAVIKLTEDYGIPHNNYDHAIRCMKQVMYANATLTDEFEVTA